MGWVCEGKRGMEEGLELGSNKGSRALAALGPSFLPTVPTCFLSPVLATGPTLSMGLLVTTAVSGILSSAPVEHGNFQAPFERYFPVDCELAMGLETRK